MEKYELYYLEDSIGELYVDEEDNLQYFPVKEGIKKNELYIFEFLKVERRCAINDFPFLYSRLTIMNNNNLDVLRYPNSNYMIKRTSR